VRVKMLKRYLFFILLLRMIVDTYHTYLLMYIVCFQI